jgi:lysophospholipase L1-like esterase
MSLRSQTRMLATLAAVALFGSASLAAQVDDPDPSRFTETFDDWATHDAENSAPANPIVFVGSSSINFWRTAEYFPQFPVINRGFGGSQASDATHWVHEAVLKYDPSVVVYYEGDNDVNVGKKAPQIFEDMKQFAEAVHGESPGTHVVFLSVKPSLSRWQHWTESQATNSLLEDYAAGRYNVHFVDVGTDMLGGDGEPIPELFIADGLHMTPMGYEIWTGLVTPVLAALR